MKIRKKSFEKKQKWNIVLNSENFLNTLRKIFTNDKNDVNYFIKHQCD